VLGPRNQTRLLPIAAGNSDRILSASPAYESLGMRAYYLPALESALTDKGSRPASAAGLFHYTTRRNQTKEAVSTVDIGLHYPAFQDGRPMDTDGDGMNDSAEDTNGDGLTSSGETGWTSYDSRNRLANQGQAGLLVFTPIK